MLRILAAAALLLLAGCASPADDPSPMTLEEAAKAATTLEEDAAAAPGPALPQPVTLQCTLKRTQIGTSTGYGLNVDRALTGIDECHIEQMAGNLSWANAAVLEATWTGQASQTGTDLWVELTDCVPEIPPSGCSQGETTGSASPLRLDLGADDLRAMEGRDPLAMASGQGAVVDLVYTLYITLFPGAVPDGFTAVP